jgi:Lar family restriction alleviation protein
MTEKLKPCPFCGSDATAIQAKSGVWFIRCVSNLCAVHVRGEQKESAIHKWNQRRR